jgi:uncharacterized protein (TIGR02996 family)
MTAPANLQDAFLAAIRDDPEEDAPRLIFADWLEEQGDPRGEFIRVQCALAGMGQDDPRREELARREAELLRLHSQAWSGNPPSEIHISFRRGLLAVTVMAEVLDGDHRPASPRLLVAAARLGVTAQAQARDRAVQWLLARQGWLSDLQLYDVADEGLRHAAAHGLLARPVALTLVYGSLTDAGLAHLAGLTQLDHLSFNLLNVTGPGLGHLAGLTRLKYLELFARGLTDAGLECLTGPPQLRMLRLLNTQVTDAGLGHLAGLSQLRWLDMRASAVRGVGLKHLTRLTHLEKLSLNQTEVTGAGLEHLAGLPQLRELDLSQTRVRDAGLEHLAALTQLRVLNLHQAWVKGPGLVHLVGLRRLEKLDLGRSRVRDAGLVHLAGLTQLREVCLGGTSVTAAGREKLQAALPGCRITD